MSISIRQVHPVFVGQVSGLDITRPLATDDVAAIEAGIPVSLCGELASREQVAPLLLGLGIRQLSMHGNAIPKVKRAIRAVTMAQCEAVAVAALAAPGADAVRAIIRAG